MRKFATALLAAGVFLSMPLSAAEYQIDYKESTVSFSGEHAGNEFTGTFEDWSGDISFDPENLEESRAEITFELESAVTGNKMYDGTLPNSDWFNIKETPQGKFVSQNFSQNEDGSYHVEGLLSLRDHQHEVGFDFTLSDLTENPVMMTASLPLDRLQYDIGRKSDPEFEWVSQQIMIKLDITATKRIAE